MEDGFRQNALNTPLAFSDDPHTVNTIDKLLYFSDNSTGFYSDKVV